VLHEQGPLTYEGIGKYMLDVPVNRIQWCIQEDRRKKEKRIFRVHDWDRHVGKSGALSPIIGLGNEEDAEHPDLKQSRTEAVNRYNHEMALSRPERRLSKEEQEAIREQKRAEREAAREEAQQAEARAVNVFANMFMPVAPVEVKGTTSRQYRTSNQEPTKHAKNKQDVRTHPSAD
jgi:hypothetical protein